MNDTFLDEYLKIASDCTDSPEVFHQYLSLIIAGVCIGRKRWIQFGAKKIYPNFYLTIIGASAAARKSTALNISKNLLKKILPDVILPNEFSHEELTKVLKDNSGGCFYYDEFRSLIGLLNKDYMGSTKSFLAEAWDCPDYYNRQTKGDGKIEILNMCPSLISATTLDWFQKSITESDIDGGFLNRFIFIMGKKTQHYGWPPSMDYAKFYNLTSYLSVLINLQPTELIVPDNVRQLQIDWSKQLAKKIDGVPYYALFARLHVYVLKIAVILSALNREDTLTKLTLAHAQIMVDEIAEGLLGLCNSQLSFNKIESEGQKIIEILKESPHWITKRDLMRKRHLSRKEYTAVIETLMDREEIKIAPDGKLSLVTEAVTGQKTL